MRKIFLTAALFVLGVRYAYNYLISEDFQKFADKKKAPWTCQVNNTLAGMFQTTSSYDKALNLYNRTMARCPETPMAETALFQKAVCLEDLYNPQEAFVVYQQYRETYPGGEHYKNASNAADRIKFSK